MSDKVKQDNAPVGPIKSGTSSDSNSTRTWWHNTETGEKGHSTTVKNSGGDVSHYTHQDGSPKGNDAPAKGWVEPAK